MKMFEALASGDSVELRVYGPIGGGLFCEGVSAADFARALEASPGAKTIRIRLNSPGGSAYDGMAIRSMLVGHPAHKTCEVEGLAASAGSIVAMGCDVIRMHTGSAMMVHEAAAILRVASNANDLRKVLSGLETLNDGLASVYAERTGLSKAKVLRMMSDETWLTPEQAVEKKFADETVASTTAPKMAASFDLGAWGYRNVPSHLATADDDSPGDEEPDADAADDEEEDESDDAGESDVDDEADDDESDPEEADTDPPQPPAAVEPPVSRHDAVATTAEATTAARMRSEKMTIKLIAQAVGLQADADEAAVFTAVNRIQGMLAELRTITGATDAESILGTVRGLHATAQQATAMKSQLIEQAKKIEDAERAALIAADKADPKGRKLTPPLEKLFSEKSPAELKAFLEAASHVVVVAPAPTATQPLPAAGSGTEAITFNGKSWEELTAADKHNLHVDDKATYTALRDSWIARGKPQPKQQRASA